MMAKTSKQRGWSRFIYLALLVFSHVFPQSTNAGGPWCVTLSDLRIVTIAVKIPSFFKVPQVAVVAWTKRFLLAIFPSSVG